MTPGTPRGTRVACACICFLGAAAEGGLILRQGWAAGEALVLAVLFAIGLNDWLKAWDDAKA